MWRFIIFIVRSICGLQDNSCSQFCVRFFVSAVAIFPTFGVANDDSFPEPIDKVNELISKVDKNTDSVSWLLSEAVCKGYTGWDGDGFESCELELLAAGTIPALVIVSDCGDHLCSVDRYIWYNDAKAPYHRSDYGPISVEVSPDHEFLLVGSLQTRDGVVIGAQTRRIHFGTGNNSFFAPCISAVLSPDKNEYFCRNMNGDVLKAPLRGGVFTPVVKAALPEGESTKIGGAFDDFPGPVRFVGDNIIEFDHYLSSEEVITQRYQLSSP